MPSGTLYLVATPIGNLEDITLRALRVLKEVSVIAAEDTRRTRKLLTHFGISTPTVSFHAHNATRQAPVLMAWLNGGRSIALVTDAGTPGISDPGTDLLRLALKAGIPCDAIPGASAPLMAAVLSGFALDHIHINGFLPNRSKDRIDVIEALEKARETSVFFEAPHRIRATLLEMDRILGNRPIMVGRELTKLHQELLRGTAHEVSRRLDVPKGEFTIVVSPALSSSETNALSVDVIVIRHDFDQLTNRGALTRREIVRTLAAKYGLRPRQVYALVQGDRVVR